MLIVAGTGYVDPDHRDALLESLAPAVRRARTAPGCLDYVVAADPIEPDRVNIYERWESEAHLGTHLAGSAPAPMPEVRAVEVVRYDVSGARPLRG
ncbi:putative quinol monooxygenase [Dactylosporangium siamense]|uniref:Antibiotic biosynthesis monooxygenase n=1 Tax=Dactylosporangium siamense TaxID=685454 RepID=A0A919PKB1_9ACTN|nr:putative quinol monooxygenase [Dactylosporangium siamense]GIG45092.1 antibiotic biosynthesis monooxygenase [Dactylosporangium siamense]